MNWEPSGFQQGIGPADRKYCVVLGPATAFAPMMNANADCEVELVIDSGVHLSCFTMETYEGLKQAVKSVCHVYDGSFRGQLEAGDSFEACFIVRMQTGLCDPLHNFCQIDELSSSEHGS